MTLVKAKLVSTDGEAPLSLCLTQPSFGFNSELI